MNPIRDYITNKTTRITLEICAAGEKVYEFSLASIDDKPLVGSGAISYTGKDMYSGETTEITSFVTLDDAIEQVEDAGKSLFRLTDGKLAFGEDVKVETTER